MVWRLANILGEKGCLIRRGVYSKLQEQKPQQSKGDFKLKLKVFLEEGATKPNRAHNSDAGLDLYSRESKTIYAGQAETFDTGGSHRSFQKIPSDS